MIVWRVVLRFFATVVAVVSLVELSSQDTFTFPYWSWLMGGMLVGLLLLAMIGVRYAGKVGVNTWYFTRICADVLAHVITHNWQHIAALSVIIVVFASTITGCLACAAGWSLPPLLALRLTGECVGFLGASTFLGVSFEWTRLEELAVLEQAIEKRKQKGIKTR